MILFDTAQLIPGKNRKIYRIAQAMLLLCFILSGTAFAYKTLFPSQEFLFAFEAPDTSRNTLEEPFTETGESRKKGRLSESEPLRTYAGTVGSFSLVRIRLTLEKDSPLPQNAPSVSVRKSYRSFFYPQGDPLTFPSKDRAFLIDEKAYLFSDGNMSPFISDAATLSRFPKDSITRTSRELLAAFPAQETPVGFRPGSLLSDTEGVYAIGGDTKAHPIGNTSVFESLGFSWSDVLPVSAEELQFHKRGKIYLYDAAQPDGTLFSDATVKTLYLTENGTKRPVENQEVAETLRKLSTPIGISEKALASPDSCKLEKQTLSLRPSYVCDMPIENLKRFPGGSFEITLDPGGTIHAAELSVVFETKPDQENLSLFIGQIRERFDTVYGK